MYQRPQAANRVSNPCRTEALDFREVGIVGDNATPETKRCSGNHAVRHRQIPMHALQEPGLPPQLRVEFHHLQPTALLNAVTSSELDGDRRLPPAGDLDDLSRTLHAVDKEPPIK